MAAPPSRPRWAGPARGGRLGNLFFAVLVRHAFWLTPFFLAFVAGWFVLFAPEARRASVELCRRLGRGRTVLGRWWFAYRHLFTFGTLLLDRLAILGGQAAAFRIEFDGEQHIREALRGGRGVVLLTGHCGNWEAMAHLLTRLDAPVRAVMYDGAQRAMKATLERLAAGRSFDVIYTDGSPASAAQVLAALEEGCIVGMMGDRTLAGEGVDVPFLGGTAHLPLAPYVVAAAAGAPLIHVFALRLGWRRYRFVGSTPHALAYRSRKTRRDDLRRWAAAYAARLEAVVREAPLQWGNFYPFWQEADAGRGG